MTLNNTSAILLPKSHTARRFLGKFGHPYKFIEAKNPYVSQETGKRKRGFAKKQETKWRTENKYPLRPRTLWRRFEDPRDLIGVSFGEYTHYVTLDFDTGNNPYHPAKDESMFKNLLGVLEDIGLVRPIVLRSSWSDGLHVYYFFKEAVKSFDIACAMEGALRQAGIKPKSGQVELFPNTKSYGSHYKSVRLPLQPETGSTILDDNYEPLTDDVESFLNMADRTAEHQDMDLIKAACKKYGTLLRLERCARGKNSLKKFENDLLDEFSEGFTAAGQTNSLLLTIACYGVVFMGLDEEGGIEPLADYIVDTITNLEGYSQYCNHQHEIDRRAREVAKSSQSFYWAVGKNRKRKRTFKDTFGELLDSAVNGNQARAIQTLQRLEIVLEQLKESGEHIPTGLKAFMLLLSEKSKATFDKGFSPVTLGKQNYKSKWLPVFTALLAAQVAVSQPAEAVALVPIMDTQIEEVAQQSEQHDPLQNQLLLSTITLISGVLQEGCKSAVDSPPKTAETRTEQQWYTPCKKVRVSKSPEPAQNKDSTHLALYGGFGEGAAPTSENIKNSFVPKPHPITKAAQAELKQQRNSASKPKHLSATAHQASSSEFKPSSTSQSISSTNQSTAKKPRPTLKNHDKQRLSVQSQQQHDQLQALHALNNRLEAQRIEPEYQSMAKQSFAAIRRILARAGATFKRGNPSPPT